MWPPLRRQKRLPQEASPPQTKVRVLKELGTACKDVLLLEQQSLFNTDNLLQKAQAERVQREARGISDATEACQPMKPPPFDSRIVGKQIEVLWPYGRW